MIRPKKLSMLLGAGFSQGFGLPGTDALTAALMERAEPRDISVMIWEGLLSFAPRANFETMFQAVETLYSIKQTKPTSSTQAIAVAFADLKPRWREITSEQLRALYTGCHHVLHAELSKAAEDAERTVDGAFDRTAVMIKRFASAFEPTVFDLNYDDVGENILGDVRDGFANDGSPSGFELERFRASDGLVEWCHLHGSLRYEMREFEARIVKHRSREAAASTFGRALRIMTQDNESATQGPIVTSLRKIVHSRFDPFPIYYDRFVTEMLDCPRLLVIGYGGGDEHISPWLWTWRRVHGERARLVWITHRRNVDGPNQDLRFPQYAVGDGGYGHVVKFSDADVARGEYRTPNAYVIFGGSPTLDDVTTRAIEFLTGT